MDVVERIARVLAGRRLSLNAEGENVSAAAEVDASWRDHRDDSLAVLHTLRKPDRVISDAGDQEIWERMVDAALSETGAAS